MRSRDAFLSQRVKAEYQHPTEHVYPFHQSATILLPEVAKVANLGTDYINHHLSFDIYSSICAEPLPTKRPQQYGSAPRRCHFRTTSKYTCEVNDVFCLRVTNQGFREDVTTVEVDRVVRTIGCETTRERYIIRLLATTGGPTVTSHIDGDQVLTQAVLQVLAPP